MFIKIRKGEFMNRYEKDIVIELMTEPFINQRILAEKGDTAIQC